MGRYRYVATEKQEKRFEAKIWWVLWGVCLVVLLFTANHHIREYDLIHNGHCIEAEYYTYNGRDLARYRDENDSLYVYDISDYSAIHGEDTVLLYYKDKIALAQPQRKVISWILPYLFAGAGLAAFSFMLYKIYTRRE